MVLWDKKIPTRNRDPLFCIKSFDTRKFLKPRVVTLRNFPALWEKKFSTVNNDNPLLSFKISDTRNFLKDRESPYEFFLYCEKNNFRQIRDTPSYAIFIDPEIFWNKRVPLRLFSVLWDKKISKESRDIPFLSIKFFDKRMFLKKGGFPHEIFWYCDKFNFRQNRDTPSYAIFQSRTFLKEKGPPRNFFGTVRQKCFERKSWFPPPIHKFFR